MRLTKGILGSAAAVLLLFAADGALAEPTRVTNPNAFSVELLGRGLLYSVNFDRALNDDVAAGFGYGGVSTKIGGNDAHVTASMIPAYFNYYFMRDQGSLFVTAGVTIVTNSGDTEGKSAATSGVDFPSRGVLPEAGVGYENRGDSGFLFRMTAYGIYAEKVSPWLGFTFGYAF